MIFQKVSTHEREFLRIIIGNSFPRTLKSGSFFPSHVEKRVRSIAFFPHEQSQRTNWDDYKEQSSSLIIVVRSNSVQETVRPDSKAKFELGKEPDGWIKKRWEMTRTNTTPEMDVARSIFRTWTSIPDSMMFTWVSRYFQGRNMDRFIEGSSPVGSCLACSSSSSSTYLLGRFSKSKRWWWSGLTIDISTSLTNLPLKKAILLPPWPTSPSSLWTNDLRIV